jgi:hypothetical protein
MKQRNLAVLAAFSFVAIGLFTGLSIVGHAENDGTSGTPAQASGNLSGYDNAVNQHAREQIDEGRTIFRFDTFGNEAFWGDALQLHKAIAGAQNGGVGPGVSPKTALAVGLKVDADALPATLQEQIKTGQVDLDDPKTTVALMKLNAVVGVKGLFDASGNLKSMGVQCALCHSTVDDSFAPGIGRRLDGWAARDLNIGKIISLAPNLKPYTDLLGVDEATLKKVLDSWGPGRFDAILDKDGKAFRPDGKQAGTLIPPAFGLAGVNLHTWTGMGSVPYWNAYVAVTEMHGSGTFFDERLNDPVQYPIAAKSGSWNVRNTPDLVTSKLPALHAYQMSLAAPKPPKESFDEAAAARGKTVFAGRAKCASCHVPPLFTEPGNNLHSPEEIGIDSFQADRSPTHKYRTAPLAGLWTHQKPGFYHDGRFTTLREVIEHYNSVKQLALSEQDKTDLIEYLKSN